MQGTRIKWDESMMTRCLARLVDYYAEPAKIKKQAAAPDKAAPDEAIPDRGSDFSLELDIPTLSPEASSKVVLKTSRWDDFKRAIDNAL